MVASTVVCSFNYIKLSVAEWSTQSFSSPELLAHAAWLYRFESCRWFYSVYTNKKLYHPSSLSCVLAVAPTMKRSAVQPKTTRLCSSIRVISLCSYPKPPCHISSPESHTILIFSQCHEKLTALVNCSTVTCHCKLLSLNTF